MFMKKIHLVVKIIMGGSKNIIQCAKKHEKDLPKNN